MKKVLGLDLGTNSVGFAIVQFSDDENQGQIIQMGARIVPKDPDFHGVFEKGALGADSKNAKRRVKRGIRRGYQRWQGRRNRLLEILKRHNMLPDDLKTDFPDNAVKTDEKSISPAYRLYELRAKAATQQITLKEFGRVLLLLNNKRGFKSNKKAQSEEEKETDYEKPLSDENESIGEKTIGEYLLSLLQKNPYTRLKGRTFYRKKYIEEFDRIWTVQRKGREQILTGEPGKKDYKSLYSILKNDIIYFQRPLKSAKGLVGKCRYEPHLACSPVSSPLFQHFRIWKTLNDIRINRESGEDEFISHQQKLRIFEALHDPASLDANNNLTAKSKKIKDILGIQKNKDKLNFETIPGNKTYLVIRKALETAGVINPENLRFTWENEEHKPASEKTGLNALWHLSYSLDNEETLVNALLKGNRFGMTEEQARMYAKEIGFPQEFSSLSAKAIRKLIPHLENGYNEYEATLEVKYRHTDEETNEEKKAKELEPFVSLVKPNELRNPVVEQILNQAIHIVNAISEKYGKPDEVRIELARSLRATADQRSNQTKRMRELESLNKVFEKEIAQIKGSPTITARDRERLKLWKETKMRCLYSGKTINQSDVFNGRTEIEHIIPRSLFADNSLQNKILVFKEFNEKKGQRTAWDYIQQDKPRDPESYKKEVMELLKNPKKDKNGQGIGKLKRDYLLITQENIPSDFTAAQLKATEYISTEISKRLKSCIRQVTLTSGSVTAILRDDWGLNDILRDINLPRYAKVGKVVQELRYNAHKNDNYTITKIEDWSKRDDHRHHALDALIVALTTQGVIQKINSLNASNGKVNIGVNKQRFPIPVGNIHNQVKEHLNQMLVSFKKSSKAVTIKRSKAQRPNGDRFDIETLVPRGQLHKDNLIGKSKIIADGKIPLTKAFDKPEMIISPTIKELIQERLKAYNFNVKAAIKSLDKKPILVKGRKIEEIKVYQEVNKKRVKVVDLTPDMLEDIIDPVIKKILINWIGTELIEDFQKKDLKKDKKDKENKKELKKAIQEKIKTYLSQPVFFDLKKTIPIYNVTIKINREITPIRFKNDEPIAYALVENNHHAIISQDSKGNWLIDPVNIWTTTARAKLKEPVINRNSNQEKRFIMSLQINDLFYRTPEEDETPNSSWFFQPENMNKIANNLFRIQNLSGENKSCDIVFRQQFETTIQNKIRAVSYERIQSTEKLKRWIKIHLDKTGQIIRVGE